MKTVKKEWGAEHWIVNEDYCGKKLILKKGYRCSMHHHKKKDETFYIAKGMVLMEIDKEKRIMLPGDAQRIMPGVWHRFTGIEDSEIIEFSTHHEDEDSYREEPSGKCDTVDFGKIKTVPLEKRESKVSISDFKEPGGMAESLDDENLEAVANAIKTARKNKKHVVFMLGAHVIKCGLSLYIIDLMKKGFVQHVAMNGAGAVHDFEIAFCGKTSEDVARNIEDGTFGMAEETGRMINEALKESKYGYGRTLGQMMENFKHKDYSIAYNAYKLGIPLSVHTTIGAEIIYQHPSCDGAAIGRASYEDFRLITASIANLNGGVLLNIGSAVVLPEVFLKALSIVRNLGFDVKNITTANLDMIKHYRPDVNIVTRPVSLGGRGYHVIGRHEKTIPTLYKLLHEN